MGSKGRYFISNFLFISSGFIGISFSRDTLISLGRLSPDSGSSTKMLLRSRVGNLKFALLTMFEYSKVLSLNRLDRFEMYLWLEELTFYFYLFLGSVLGISLTKNFGSTSERFFLMEVGSEVWWIVDLERWSICEKILLNVIFCTWSSYRGLGFSFSTKHWSSWTP